MTTTKKTCFKCKLQKSYEAFYRHSAMADGHLGKCIECTKKDVAKHREDNIHKIRQYDRDRSNKPHRVEARYRIIKKWAEDHPDRNKAQNILGNAVRDGKILRGTHCQHCGSSGRIEGHHQDYSRPLDVVLLCVPCHRQAHAMIYKERKAA